MSFDLDRYEDGYLLTLFPPMVEAKVEMRGLEDVDVRTELRGRSVHPVDIEEAILAADAGFKRGVTDRSRLIRDIWRRASGGHATSGDVEVLREELRAGTRGGRKTYLINALYMAGEKAEALELVLQLLEVSEEWDDVELGLRFLSEWSPEMYERVAVRFIRGVPWDKMGVQGWAMVYAGGLLARGLAPSLLDEIAQIVLDADAGVAARRDARNALARAAGFEVTSPESHHIFLHASESELRQLTEAIRARLERP